MPAPLVMPLVAGKIAIAYILMRLFFLVVAFNIMWTFFLWFLVTYAAPAALTGSGGSLWSGVQVVVNVMHYLKAERCIVLMITTIQVKIVRKYIVDKAYDAIFS